MEVKVEYWSPINKTIICENGFRYLDSIPSLKRIEILKGDNIESIFKQYYDLNNSLRYCNGTYYKFENYNFKDQYFKWLNTLSESTRFHMYYGNGIVD